jgi:hypothetical protein
MPKENTYMPYDDFSEYSLYLLENNYLPQVMENLKN